MAIPTHYSALSAYLGQHVESEEHALHAYEELLENRPNDIASYLMRMILRDEAHHHQMFADMRETLENRIHWRRSESEVPSLRIAGDVNALLAATDSLLRSERADLRELRRLRRTWRRSADERRMWGLLVETAWLDTKKHIRILRYLRGLLVDARRQADRSDITTTSTESTDS